MTAGEEAWWAAVVGLSQFAPGGFDFDTSLSVQGGGTANLRVKLTARPRSDVTVALSETSALISLGVASLVFTPDNWDTYQSVTVTGAVGRQEIALLNAWYESGNSRWRVLTGRPQIVAGLRPSNARYFFALLIGSNGVVRLDIALTASGAAGSNPEDLTSAFETNGSIQITFDGTTYRFELAGADTEEPYQWTPANSNDAIALQSALQAASDRSADLILRDYVPGDAVIGLSASGPTEYSGVTGSATVSVT